MNRDSIAYALSILTGLAACLAVTLVTGRREAWDSSLYFAAALPAMTIAAFALGYLFPQRAWRWGVAMAFGQSIAMVIGGGSLGLWPLALVAMAIVSIPQIVAAVVAARLAPKRTAP